MELSMAGRASRLCRSFFGPSNAGASAPCGVMVGHCLKRLHARSGLVALADDDLQKGTKVRRLVVGR
jgi:hypothetical protein